MGSSLSNIGGTTTSKSTASEELQRQQTEPRVYTYTVYHNETWYGMFAVAVILLTLYSLLAGLTLGVCGLESTWVQLKCVTGTPKQRYSSGLTSSVLCVLTITQEKSSRGCSYKTPRNVDAL